MLGFERHNWLASAPTNTCMPLPISCVTPLDQDFPLSLRRLPTAVAHLWYRGRLPAQGQAAVAMVGSRAATRQACDLATRMAAALAGAGRAVISGGALGIDAAAHRGALEGGGPTFAVLGCGVDVVYPDRHGPLFAEIVARGGGLLSEYPPGWQPRPGQFPIRNRIVAALAQAVVVVEARPASGALITARLALELGRRLFAVPGSPGTDALVTAGAAPVEAPASLLAQLAGAPPPARQVPPALAGLIAALDAGAAAPAEIARRLGTTVGQVLGQLAEAELAGWARRLPGGRFEVPRAC
jgi:DNA processing protein